MSSSSQSCLDEDLAYRLASGRVSSAERLTSEQHLSNCEDCRAWLVQLLNSESLGNPPPAATSHENETSGDRDPLIGTIIGQYRLDQWLGRGAAGLVYRAYDENLQRHVAIKLLRRVGDSTAQTRMQSEALTLAELRHPNVVAIFDVNEIDGDVYIVMELVGGGSLRAWCRQEPPPWRHVIARLAEVAQGLAHIHDAGFVHRDIKPDNILLHTAPERALIADLGLTGDNRDEEAGSDGHIFSREAGHPNRPDLVVGTPGYMAPEVSRGERATAWSDQFSFGRSMQELLGSRRSSVDSFEDPPRALPASVRRVIDRCTHAVPQARYDDMHDVHRELRRLLHRSHTPIIVGVTLVIVALITAFVLLWSPRAANPACSRLRAASSQVWTQAQRDASEKNFRARDPARGPSAFAAVDQILSRRRQAWLEAGASLCRASSRPGGNVGRESGGAELARQVCLERELARLARFASMLSSLDTSAILLAEEAAVAFPLPRACDQRKPDPALPQQHVAQGLRVRTLIDSALTHVALGQLAIARRQLRSVQADLEALASDALQAEFFYALSRLEIAGNEETRGFEHLRQALAAGERSGHDRIRALSLASLMRAPGQTQAQALDYGQRAQAVVSRLLNRDDLAFAVEEAHVKAYVSYGELAQACRAAHRALALLRSTEVATTRARIELQRVLDGCDGARD